MFNIFNLNNHLDSDEKVLLFFRPSRKAYVIIYVFLIIVLLVALFFVDYGPNGSPLFIFWRFVNYASMLVLAFDVVMLLRLEYRIWSRRYALTSERIMYSRGILSEVFKSAQYKYISDIEFEQSFWDKLMDTGTLKIHTIGTDEYQIRYRKVSQPLKIKKMMNDMQTQFIPRRKRKSGS